MYKRHSSVNPKPVPLPHCAQPCKGSHRRDKGCCVCINVTCTHLQLSEGVGVVSQAKRVEIVTCKADTASSNVIPMQERLPALHVGLTCHITCPSTSSATLHKTVKVAQGNRTARVEGVEARAPLEDITAAEPVGLGEPQQQHLCKAYYQAVYSMAHEEQRDNGVRSDPLGAWQEGEVQARSNLNAEGGDDALRVHQVGVAQVVQAIIAEDLGPGLEPHRLSNWNAVLGQQLRRDDAQSAE